MAFFDRCAAWTAVSLFSVACGRMPLANNDSVSSAAKGTALAPANTCPMALPEPAAASDVLGINLDLSNGFGRPDPKELTKIGIKWLRTEFRPYKNDYNAAIDALAGKNSSISVGALKTYRDAGIKAVLIVDYLMSSKWYNPDFTDQKWSEFLSDYKSNLAKVTKGLSAQVDVWQVWNEPDLLVGHYQPYLPPKRFAELLAESYKIIRQSSCAPIVLGGLANGDGGIFLKEVIGNYRAANQDSFPFDAIAIHPYGRGVNGLYEAFGKFDVLINAYKKNALKPYGLDKTVKVVISEAGTNDGDESKFQPYTSGMYQAAFKMKIPFMTWFAWDDRMVNGFGLQRADGSKRGTYLGIQDIAKTAVALP